MNDRETLGKMLCELLDVQGVPGLHNATPAVLFAMRVAAQRLYDLGRERGIDESAYVAQEAIANGVVVLSAGEVATLILNLKGQHVTDAVLASFLEASNG